MKEQNQFIYDVLYNKSWNFVENPEIDACIQTVVDIVSVLKNNMTNLNYYELLSRATSMEDLRKIVKVLLNDYKYFYTKILSGEYDISKIQIYDSINEYLKSNPDYVSVITAKRIIDKSLEQDMNRKFR